MVSAVDPAAQVALEDLHRKMTAFYNSDAMTRYYACADTSNVTWSDAYGQSLIRKLAAPGGHVVDFGCGSAHAFRHLADSSVRYTGCDVSADQIQNNRRRFGDAAHFTATSLYETPFDDSLFEMAFSTYVLEHLVWPHRCLGEMVRVTKPGGFIVVVCPHFRPRNRIPSLFYGSSNSTIKDRVRQGDVAGTLRHAWLRQIHYPRLLRRTCPPDKWPFLINLSPSCLDGAYYPDNDAVYFTLASEIKSFLTNLGASDVTERFIKMHRIREDRGTVVIVAQKGSPP